MSFYRLLIGWTNNVTEETADHWKAKGEVNIARTHIFQWSSLIYQMFEVCKSHYACMWLIFKTIIKQFVLFCDSCVLCYCDQPCVQFGTFMVLVNGHKCWGNSTYKRHLENMCHAKNVTYNYCRTELGRRLIISQVTKVVFFSKSVFASIRGTSHDVANCIIFSKEMSIISARFLSKWLLRERWPPM